MVMGLVGSDELTGSTLGREWWVCRSGKQRLWPRGMKWQLAAQHLAPPSGEVVTMREAWRHRAESVGYLLRGKAGG